MASSLLDSISAYTLLYDDRYTEGQTIANPHHFMALYKSTDTVSETVLRTNDAYGHERP